MALKACRECKKEISTEAKVCPNCGATTPTKEAGNQQVSEFLLGLAILGGCVWGAVSYFSDDEVTRAVTLAPIVEGSPDRASEPVKAPEPASEDTAEYVPPPTDKAKAKRVAERIMKLVKAGNNLEVLRQTNTETCVGRMKELMASAAGLESEAKSVNGATAYLLGSAALRLNNCLSCRKNSKEDCVRAANEVKEAMAVVNW